jgi:hypothetical protein
VNGEFWIALSGRRRAGMPGLDAPFWPSSLELAIVRPADSIRFVFMPDVVFMLESAAASFSNFVQHKSLIGARLYLYNYHFNRQAKWLRRC